MNDTAPVIQERYRTLLLARSGEERLKMGCSMHATARALVRASVLAVDPQVSPAGLRRAYFLRFYSREFDPAARARILLAIEMEDGAEGGCAPFPRPR